MKTLPGRIAGFSLIEVTCAILVLGIALAGLTHGVSVALSSTKDSELQTTAALIAAGQIETLRAEGDLSDGTTEGQCEEGLSLYQWKQTISKTELEGLHQVEIVVENAKSGKLIFELQTLLFEVPQDSPTSANKRRDTSGKRKGERGR